MSYVHNFLSAALLGYFYFTIVIVTVSGAILSPIGEKFIREEGRQFLRITYASVWVRFEKWTWRSILPLGTLFAIWLVAHYHGNTYGVVYLFVEIAYYVLSYKMYRLLTNRDGLSA